MRNATAVLLAASLLVSTAAVASEGALAPGKPAGVHQAQFLTTPIIIVGIVAAAAAGAAIASSKGTQSVVGSTAPVVGTP